MKEIHNHALIGFEFIMDKLCDCMWGLCCFCFLPVTLPLALVGWLVGRPKSPTDYEGGKL